jgi:hypothetical protein
LGGTAGVEGLRGDDQWVLGLDFGGQAGEEVAFSYAALAEANFFDLW